MKQTIQFPHRTDMLAGHLHLPDNFSADRRYPAIVCVHPGSSCKDQTAGIYAAKLAELGFIALAFDARFQGDSAGEPRYIEDPSSRIEDIRCAVDYLLSLSYVDEARIGALGICAGGGYSVSAAMTEPRIRALATVAGANIGRIYRQGGGSAGAALQTLQAVAAQRTLEVRGAEPLISNWIPCSPEAAASAGVSDIDLLQAVDYYTTERGQHACSPNKLRFTSIAGVIGFDAFHLVEQLLRQPLQIIVGSIPGGFGSFQDGHELYRRAQCDKDLYIIEGVSHYDLYDQEQAVGKAVARLGEFYTKHLKPA